MERGEKNSTGKAEMLRADGFARLTAFYIDLDQQYFRNCGFNGARMSSSWGIRRFGMNYSWGNYVNQISGKVSLRLPMEDP